MRPRSFVVVLGLASFIALQNTAQSQTADSARRVRTFIDCKVQGCDLDYFRREIQFVDHMRDPADASVHLLITAAATGSGGTAYTLNFIGRGEFANLSDTLRFSVSQTA